jgi:hypothetical protein
VSGCDSDRSRTPDTSRSAARAPIKPTSFGPGPIQRGIAGSRDQPLLSGAMEEAIGWFHAAIDASIPA